MDGKEYNNKAYYDTIYQMNSVPDESRIEFYNATAKQIATLFSPKTVLDVGCATGYLLSGFRDLDIDCFGIDISEWAVNQIQERDRSFAKVQSLFDSLPESFPQHYDLVTCIEVAEHIPEEDADKLIKRLCQLGDYVVFSSSPSDLEDRTHCNVQQAEYWCKRFASNGFYRTMDRILTLPTEWTLCFTKTTWNKAQIVEAYERSIRIGHLKNKESRKSITCSFFFGDDNGFSEQKCTKYTEEVDQYEDTVHIYRDVPVPDGCTNIRIDPCEDYPIAVDWIKVLYNGELIEPRPVNGMVFFDRILFSSEDPQFLVDIPDAGSRIMHIDICLHLYSPQDPLLGQIKEYFTKQSKEKEKLAYEADKRETELRLEIETQAQKASERETELLQEIEKQAQEADKKEIELNGIRKAYREKLIGLTVNHENRIQEQEKALREKDQYIGSVVMICDDRLAQINNLQQELENQRADNSQLSQRCENAEKEFVRISNSSFWKLTKPARMCLDGIKRVLQKDKKFYLFLLSIKWRIVYGKEETAKRRKDYMSWNGMSVDVTYHNDIILEQDLLNGYYEDFDQYNEEYNQQKNTSFLTNCKISIVVPLFNTPESFLKEMICSVLGQSYANWELCLADGSDKNHREIKHICKKYARKDRRIRYKRLNKNLGISENTNAGIKMSTGEYIALLDHDDMLHPCALYEVMKVINEREADFIYTDESSFHDKPKDAFCPHFKPDFSPDTLRSYNYICHLTTFNRELLNKAGGGFRSEYDGSQDYDMILRLTEAADHIVHIPKIMYYWRSHPVSVASDISAKPYTIEAAKKALTAHLSRLDLHGIVTDSRIPSTYHIKYDINENPKISIIIPNKDHVEDLAKCINSIRELSTWNNWEIIIVENNSKEGQTFVYYKDICEKDKRISVIYWEKGFNYAAICNFGAEKASGKYLLMLNNDTEVITPNWMEEMLMFAQRDDVGAAGAMLYYLDETIQHAGVILGLGGVAGHSHKYFHRNEYGYAYRLSIAQNLSAVTGACMLIRKTVFDQVKGFDENFAVAFNDVDICMKIHKEGYLIVWTPYAELYHYESKSRGVEDTVEKQRRFASEIKRFRNKWGNELATGDPYYNPNLTLEHENFEIRKKA